MGDMPLMTRTAPSSSTAPSASSSARCTARRACCSTMTAARPTRQRQVPVRRARHPVSRQLARLRVRRQGHRQRPHRPQAQAAGHRAALCARHDERGDPQHLLQPRHLRPRQGRLAGPLSPPKHWRGQKPSYDVVDADTGEVVFPAGAEDHAARAPTRRPRTASRTLLIPTEEIFGRYSAYDLINEKTGEIYIEAGDEVTAGEPRQARQGRHRRSSSCSTSTMSTPARGSATR